MVIDLAAMHGDKLIDIPLSNGRVPKMQLALPHAYAYLDAATSSDIPRKEPKSGRLLGASVEDFLSLERPRVQKCLPEAAFEQCIEISITRGKEKQGGGLFVLDSNLAIQSFTPHAPEKNGLDEAYWSKRFKSVVQQGQYVGTPQ